MQKIKFISSFLFIIAIIFGCKSDSTNSSSSTKTKLLKPNPDLRVQVPHALKVEDFDFTENSSGIFTVSRDNTARVWDIATGKIRFMITKQPTNPFLFARFHPATKNIISENYRLKRRLYDANTGKLLFKNQRKPFIYIHSLKALCLTSEDAKTLQIKHLHTGKLIKEFIGHQAPIQNYIISADGKKLITVAKDKVMKYWEFNTGRLLNTISLKDTVHSLNFVPKQAQALVLYQNKKLQLVDLSSGNVLYTTQLSQEYPHIHHNDQSFIIEAFKEAYELRKLSSGKLIKSFGILKEASFSPNGATLLTTDTAQNYALWNARNGQLLAKFSKKRVIVSSNQTRLISFERKVYGKANIKKAYELKVWNLNTGKLLKTFQEKRKSIIAAAITPDNSRLIVCTDKVIKVWEITSGKLLYTKQKNEGFSSKIYVSPNGKTALIQSKSPSEFKSLPGDNLLVLWDIETGKTLHNFKGHRFDLYKAKFSADGSKLATKSFGYNDSGSLKVWEVKTAKLLLTIKDSQQWIKTTQFSHDGRQLLTSSMSYQGKTSIWNISKDSIVKFFDKKESKRITEHFPSFYNQAINLKSYSKISPDQQWQVNHKIQEIEILKVTNPNKTHTIKIKNDRIEEVLISPDSKNILVNLESGHFKVWQLHTGKPLFSFTSHNPVRLATYSSDGKSIVTIAKNLTITLYNAQNGKALKTFRKITNDVGKVIFSNDKTKMIVFHSSTKPPTLWNIETSTIIGDLNAHTRSIQNVAFSPDDTKILTGSTDNTAILWRVKNGQLKVLCTLFSYFTDTNAAVVLTPDGRYEANKAGLKYLHYFRNGKIEPLPSNDPYQVKGLLNTLLQE